MTPTATYSMYNKAIHCKNGMVITNIQFIEKLSTKDNTTEVCVAGSTNSIIILLTSEYDLLCRSMDDIEELHPYIYTPCTNPAFLSKLLKLHSAYGKLVIGVDYDNTIRAFSSKALYTNIVSLVKRAKAQGHTICIWTGNTNPSDVIQDLHHIGIKYDYFNESPLFNQRRKPHFNVLLDDVAGLNEVYHTLSTFLEKTK